MPVTSSGAFSRRKRKIKKNVPKKNSFIFTKKLYPKNFLYFGTELNLTCYQNVSPRWPTFQTQK